MRSTSPLAPNVLFAGVESQEDYIPIELRSKLVKSTDGGRTWFESSGGIQNDFSGRSIPLAVAASTTDPNLVYAGCTGFPFAAVSSRMRAAAAGDTAMRRFFDSSVSAGGGAGVSGTGSTGRISCTAMAGYLRGDKRCARPASLPTRTDERLYITLL